VYTVTGERASEAEVDRMIETGESETIFQKAILEQGRGHVRAPAPPGLPCPEGHPRAEAGHVHPAGLPCTKRGEGHFGAGEGPRARARTPGLAVPEMRRRKREERGGWRAAWLQACSCSCGAGGVRAAGSWGVPMHICRHAAAAPLGQEARADAMAQPEDDEHADSPHPMWRVALPRPRCLPWGRPNTKRL